MISLGIMTYLLMSLTMNEITNFPLINLSEISFTILLGGVSSDANLHNFVEE